MGPKVSSGRERPEMRHGESSPLDLQGDVPRIAAHQRCDSIPKTSFRQRPENNSERAEGNVLNNQLVKLLEGPVEGYFRVMCGASGRSGWIHHKNLCEAGSVTPPRDQFMVVNRALYDEITKTSLRSSPSPELKDMRGSVFNSDVVEILRNPAPTGGWSYIKVRDEEGWIRDKYLHRRPKSSTAKPKMVPLKRSDAFWGKLEDSMRKSACGRSTCSLASFDFELAEVWQIRGGNWLGEQADAALGASKSTTWVYHGCQDKDLESIVQNGFDPSRAGLGYKSMGMCTYFSPQACKAASYAEHYILFCEVALGESHVLEATDRTLTEQKVLAKGFHSTTFHAGAPFLHEERGIFNTEQMRVAFVGKFAKKSPGGGK